MALHLAMDRVWRCKWLKYVYISLVALGLFFCGWGFLPRAQLQLPSLTMAGILSTMSNPSILSATEFGSLSSIAATVGMPTAVLESIIRANDLSRLVTVVPNEYHENASKEVVNASKLQKRANGGARTPTTERCADSGREIDGMLCYGPDPQRYVVRCVGEPVIEWFDYCDLHEVCVNTEEFRTVRCVSASSSEDEIEKAKKKHGEAPGEGVVGTQQRVSGSTSTGAVVKNRKQGSGGPVRRRAISFTAFFLTAHEPLEASQHPWLVKPATAITCSVNGTGEKLCETDLSSTSMDTYTCAPTAGKHIVDDSSVISCTFRLAATQTAIFMSVGIWHYVSTTKTLG
ncbi:hypothetical protein BCR37DRAFT_383240 [Protomyces lactucae-debilis]|uniref:Uncharacterized protein n=1 Tax=Protomyces lactucae-debilis TaxID=2754530 RepID=A0A1Y2EYP4_PROLT|nr:uncharacterized protein BCR37DRAFT_383240 [Protomyces lactucae-debilis]ORY76617.1 hypothetical protein BCR37DRAFT_383240 [Protomyces lactucae-debilis]